MGRNAIITGETNDCKIARGCIAISYFNYVTKVSSVCMNLTLDFENFTQTKHSEKNSNHAMDMHRYTFQRYQQDH